MSDAGLIVIGSGPAGVGAAEAFRARRPDAPVQILTTDNRAGDVAFAVNADAGRPLAIEHRQDAMVDSPSGTSPTVPRWVCSPATPTTTTTTAKS